MSAPLTGTAAPGTRQHGHGRGRFRLLVLLGLLGAPALPLAGQSTDTLDLRQAVAIAIATNPQLAASRLRAAAAEERIRPAGALPDPELSVGLMNRPIAGFGASEAMTMNQIGLAQRLPWPGRLRSASEGARFAAASSSLQADEVEADLTSRVIQSYYEIGAIDRSLRIMGRTRDLLRGFFEVAQELYAVGKTPQQDVLRAQIAVAQMSEEITALAQRRVAAVARFNALLGRSPDAAVSAVRLPGIGDSLPPLPELMMAVEQGRPALQAAGATVRSAEADLRGARLEVYPDLMLGASYSERPQYGDMVSFMVGVQIPIWAGSRQLPRRRAAAAALAAATADSLNLYNVTVAELTEARADAERARQLGALYTTSILPQARAAVDAALSAYRVGQVDYMTLVESEMTVNRYEIELVRLTADYHQAVARIEALLGRGGKP